MTQDGQTDTQAYCYDDSERSKAILALIELFRGGGTEATKRGVGQSNHTN